MAHKSTSPQFIAIAALVSIFIFAIVHLVGPEDGKWQQKVDVQKPSTAAEAFRTNEAPKVRAVEQKNVLNAVLVELSRSATEDDFGRWIASDKGSRWQAQELEMLHSVLFQSFRAMASIGLDGPDILNGYIFVRDNHEFVHDQKGLVAIVNHESDEIILSDAAFLRQGGFSIYHEIGHALDDRLGRALTNYFHQYAGSSERLESNGSVTGDGFWMRPAAQESLSEATADAFALWVSEKSAGMKRPVFAGMPLDVQFEAISEAIEQALLLAGEIE